MFMPVCARDALTSPSALAGRWVLSWRRLKDGDPCRRLYKTLTRARTRTQLRTDARVLLQFHFLASMTVALTD